MILKKYIAISLVALTAASCSEGLMDDINKNNGNPASETVDAKFEFPGIIMNTGFNAISGDYAFYTSTYTEQEFGTGNNQFANAELRKASETSAASTFNNVWNDTYSTLLSCKEAIEKCAEGGVNAGQSDILGVARILSVVNWQILTDMHGDIPYSEALQGQSNMTPKLDSQESIYASLESTLDEAIENLNEAIENGDDNLASSDILFNGDYSQWIGYAYALRARLALHKQLRDADAFSKALAYAQKAVEAGFDGADLTVFDDNNNNPWTAFFWSREYTGSSSTVANLLAERNDPRYNAYVCPFFDVDTPANPGDASLAQNTEVTPAPSWLNNGGCSVHFFSKSELYFIIAECQARLGQDASAAFATAVEASINDYATADAGTMGVDTSATAEYISSLPVTLKEIMVQKYIAQARDEQIEAYNDLRRAKANGEEFITLTNPENTQSVGNRWPLRAPYGQSDVRSNHNVRDAYGTGNDSGAYVFTENVWWAGGTR